MKPACCFLIVLCIISCKKNDYNQSDTEMHLNYISGIGTLVYSNNNLIKVGNINLLYNNGTLTGVRIFNLDTTITQIPVYKPNGEIDYSTSKKNTTIKENLLRYSFSNEEGIVKKIMVDSLVNTVKNIDFPFPSIEAYTNLQEAIYYYTGSRLDSIEHFFSVNGNKVKKSIFSYSEAGNISTAIDYYFQETSSIGGFPMSTVTKSVTTYEYDNQKNPWHWLYKKTGVLLPGIPAMNISPNNPIKATSVFDFNDQQLTANITYNYIYNNHGYPLSATTTAVGGNSTTTTFEY